jgi:hypothetical protein
VTDRAGKRAVVAVVLLSLACACAATAASASAHVSPVNAAATHAYLLAMNSYEEAQVANQDRSTATIEAAAAQIAGECPGILTNAPGGEGALAFGFVGPISQSPSEAEPSPRVKGERSRQSKQQGDLKLELSIALASGQAQPNREAAEALAHATASLRWSDPALTLHVHLSVAVAQEAFALQAPDVCSDMKTWVTSGYKTLAPASKQLATREQTLLVRAFELAAISEKDAIQPLPKSLAPYEDARDRALARHLEALTAELTTTSDRQAEILKHLEVDVGLPPAKAPKAIRKPVSKAVVIARGRTAAGGAFVAKARPGRDSVSSGCEVFVTITEPAHPDISGLLELLSGESTSRCLSRHRVKPEPAVHCHAGLLIIEANLPTSASSVRLLLSDGRTITSPAIRVPARLGGRAGLYYQAVRGPSPIPVSLTELDAQGGELAVVQLPAVLECTRNEVKYVPGGNVVLVRESPPQLPAFAIRAESYRKLGSPHFELDLELLGNELQVSGDRSFEDVVEQGFYTPGAQTFTSLPSGQAFTPQQGAQTFAAKASAGCEPHPYAIVYGLLKAPHDTVLARVAGELVPLRTVAIPTRLHAGGVLVYGAFSPLPSELLIRDARGRTVASDDLSQAATAETETCEGEAEG